MEPSPSKKIKKDEDPETTLSLLKKMTSIVADTGDFKEIERNTPEDSTTNPTLILKPAKNDDYKELIEEALTYGINHFQKMEENALTAKRKPKKTSGRKKKSKVIAEEKEKEEEVKIEIPPFNYENLNNIQRENLLELICDKVAVIFGTQISKLVKGYVSTEVDARLSFDKNSTVKKAKKIIKLYEEAGVDKKRILVKIAATWEGIKAAESLRKDGIQCNLTLIFSEAQAIACGNAKVTLVSPFVGRILDWNKKNFPSEDFNNEKDPGVQSVRKIYNYYKKHKVNTIVMGASFRNVQQIINLAGCDKLTIAPSLLDELNKMKDEVTQALSVDEAVKMDIPEVKLDENKFRWMLNSDAMATEKLAEGIRNFSNDLEKLENMIEEMLKKR